MITEHFEHVAGVVSQRMSALLHAPVSVIDDRGVVVASSGWDGLAQHPGAGNGSAHSYLRFAMELDGWAGEMLVGASHSDEAISPRLAGALTELLIGQIAVVEQLPNQHQLKNKLVHNLVRGVAARDADTIREAQILGMDLSRPRAVIVIDAAEFILQPDEQLAGAVDETLAQRRSQTVIDSIVEFFHLATDAICGYVGDGEVVVLKASTSQDLPDWADAQSHTGDFSPSWSNLIALKRAARALQVRLNHDTQVPIAIGIGRYHPGPRGLADSYEDARAALRLGRRHRPDEPVHCLDELGMAAFVGVSNELTKVELARQLLRPLDQEPELLQTLQVFFDENCCPSSTAIRLSIHRNTLGYRLDKVTSLIGLDPRRFDDAVQIRLALLIRALTEQES